MFHRNKRLKAFTTGCLASLVVFGYPSQLLAQSNFLDDPVQGITSTTQEAPTTAEEINDVMTGLAAGVGIGDLIEPRPMPIREYTAFQSSLWAELYESDYNIELSQITTGEWISNASGTVTTHNENDVPLQMDITMSLEILPDRFSFIDQEDIDLLSSVSARLGIAWTKLTNTSGDETRTLVFWIQKNSDTTPVTNIFPLARVSTQDIDLLEDIIVLMDGDLDDPAYYNIENLDTFGLFSSFKASVRSAVTSAVKAIAVAAVGAVLVALAPAAGAMAIALAVTAVAAYALIEATDAVENIREAREELRNALDDRGWNVDDASGAELLDAAVIEDLIHRR
ncbi:MAG: hypothetical protein JKX70_06180 [Phycisphaerales bacterium]|nr:hypothetical protein [Phycisphaerales bacterium]